MNRDLVVVLPKLGVNVLDPSLEKDLSGTFGKMNFARSLEGGDVPLNVNDTTQESLETYTPAVLPTYINLLWWCVYICINLLPVQNFKG